MAADVLATQSQGIRNHDIDLFLQEYYSLRAPRVNYFSFSMYASAFLRTENHASDRITQQWLFAHCS